MLVILEKMELPSQWDFGCWKSKLGWNVNKLNVYEYMSKMSYIGDVQHSF